jgi:hypothetical protein
MAWNSDGTSTLQDTPEQGTIDKFLTSFQI